MANRGRPANTLPRMQRGPTAEEVLMAEAEGAGVIETEEDINAALGDSEDRLEGEDYGTVRHTTPGLVQVYKLQANGVWKPVPVPVKNLNDQFRQGARANCPLCNTRTCDGLNGCEGKEKVAVMLCPVCEKVFYDDPKAAERAGQNRMLSAANREMLVDSDDTDGLKTPQARLKAKRDRHIVAYHPQEGMAMGIHSSDALPSREFVGAQ